MTDQQPCSPKPLDGKTVLLIVAHPDDEVLGVASQLYSMGHIWFVHATDGVPSKRAAKAHGFQTEAAYGQARRLELVKAIEVALAGSTTTFEFIRLEVPDGLVCLQMASMARVIACLIDRLKPDCVLTHAYEGGHPDHDSLAYASQAALNLTTHTPCRWEMALYHFGRDQLQCLTFVDGDSESVRVDLTKTERERKRQAMDQYKSQQNVVKEFHVEFESIRQAPVYDFRQAPHTGRLLYENRRRALNGWQWRWLAYREASLQDAPDTTLKRLFEIHRTLSLRLMKEFVSLWLAR